MAKNEASPKGQKRKRVSQEQSSEPAVEQVEAPIEQVDEEEEDDDEPKITIINDVQGELASDEEEDEESSEGARASKRRRSEAVVLDEEEIARAERERELDEALPEEYRHLRPRGFGFNLPPTDRSVRVYADGVFDLFHLGHMRQLEQAKKSLPNVTLICGIPSDVETHRRKGLTVLSDTQRLETLKHCKWVDEVIPNAPWCVTPEFLEEHQIDYVAHDDLPYASGADDDIYKPIKEEGKFLTTQRTEGISTSDIITKIIRDYDKYLMRNFARGASRQELNVSWFKKNELDLKRHVSEFRESFKSNFETASKDLYSEIRAYISNTLGAGFGNGNGGAGGASGSGTTTGLNSGISTPVPKARGRGGDPVTDYAANFSGGRDMLRRLQERNNSNETSSIQSALDDDAASHNRPNKSSFIGNVKGWMKSRKSVPASPSP